MGFFDNLKQQFPEVVARNSKTSPPPKAKKHPRDDVLELIDHSIRYLENPNYRIKNRKNEFALPALCFKLTGDGAIVSHKFGGNRLVIEGDNDEFEVSEKHLRSALDLLRKHVEDRNLDEQIEGLKSRAHRPSKHAKKREKSRSNLMQSVGPRPRPAGIP